MLQRRLFTDIARPARRMNPVVRLQARAACLVNAYMLQDESFQRIVRPRYRAPAQSDAA